jgi:hypothetical protein
MYKRCISLLGLALACTQAAADSATVPWNEFKALYTEHLESTRRKDEDRKAGAPPGYTLRRAEMALRADGDSVTGEIMFAGETLSPPPVIVPLIGEGTVVAAVRGESGGHVLRTAEAVAFRSDTAGPFQVTLDVVLPVARERDARSFEVPGPAAITNALRIDLPPGSRLIAAPGIPGPDGRRYLAAGQTRTIRYVNEQEAATMPPAIDIFTEITVHQHRLRLTTLLVPEQPLTRPFDLELPAGARIVSSALQDEWWRLQNDGLYRIDLPGDFDRALEIVADLDAPGSQPLQVMLPRIRGNIGAEANFTVREPVHTRVSVQGTGLAGNLPAEQLPAAIRERWPALAEFDHAGDEPVAIALEPLQSIATPELVLDAVTFYAAYGEDGQVLTTVRMAVPASAGTRLRLKPVPGAEVWSVTVNGARRDLLTEDDRAWIVPLDGNAAAEVEVALLSRHERPAMRGKLQLILPETGLSARALYFGLALPKRLELASMDGDLAPEDPARRPHPEYFKGSTYLFTRSFYRGEAIPIALAYREPAAVAAAVAVEQ